MVKKIDFFLGANSGGVFSACTISWGAQRILMI